MPSALCFVATLALVGCRQDMHNQPKFVPQRGTTFYVDGRSARPQVDNTVARGQLRSDTYFYTGMVQGQEGTALPFPVTAEVLARGQERYNIFCTPCHSRVGNGAGMIVQRGYAQAGNFHTARLQAAPLGHFFSVISNGYGAMPDYSAQLTPEDRWAVVAYIRALQLSQNAKQQDVASGEQVAPITSIAEREGLPAGFAADWTLPPTSITGTPDGQPLVLSAGSVPGPGTPSAAAPTVTRSAPTQSSTGYPNPPATPGTPTQSSTGYPNSPASPGTPN